LRRQCLRGRARKVWEALVIIDRIEWVRQDFPACSLSVRIVACEGRGAEGCDIIRWVIGQESLWPSTRDTAKRWLERLSKLPVGEQPLALPIPASATLTQVLARAS
jgi:hypothetical protein